MGLSLIGLGHFCLPVCVSFCLSVCLLVCLLVCLSVIVYMQCESAHKLHRHHHSSVIVMTATQRLTIKTEGWRTGWGISKIIANMLCMLIITIITSPRTRCLTITDKHESKQERTQAGASKQAAGKQAGRQAGSKVPLPFYSCSPSRVFLFLLIDFICTLLSPSHLSAARNSNSSLIMLEMLWCGHLFLDYN